jgi:hypothetical protein
VAAAENEMHTIANKAKQEANIAWDNMCCVNKAVLMMTAATDVRNWWKPRTPASTFWKHVTNRIFSIQPTSIQGSAMKSGVGSIRHPGTQFFEKSKNDLNTPIDRKHSLPIDCRAQN